MKKTNNNNYDNFMEGITFFVGIYGEELFQRIHRTICNMDTQTFIFIGLIVFWLIRCYICKIK